jgi:hypothetical protein
MMTHQHQGAALQGFALAGVLGRRRVLLTSSFRLGRRRRPSDTGRGDDAAGRGDRLTGIATLFVIIIIIIVITATGCQQRRHRRH